MAGRAWEPATKWRYNVFILEYSKGGMMRKGGWNEHQAALLNELGDLGWDAVNMTRLNDTQFLILMKFPIPQDSAIDEADYAAAEEYINNVFERSAAIFG